MGCGLALWGFVDMSMDVKIGENIPMARENHLRPEMKAFECNPRKMEKESGDS